MATTGGKKTVVEFRRGPADGLFIVAPKRYDMDAEELEPAGVSRYVLIQDFNQGRPALCTEDPLSMSTKMWISVRYRLTSTETSTPIRVHLAYWHPEPVPTSTKHTS